MIGPVGHAHVVERSIVDGEDANGRAVFGGHVGDGRAIGDAQSADSFAVEFDKFPDHALLAQHLRDGEDQVGRGSAFGQLAGQLEADDGGKKHRGRLAQHARFGFNAADAPADDAESVDHRCMRIGSDEGIGISGAVFFKNDRREIFEVHLMDDSGVGRDDAEILERSLAPFEERIALLIALKFHQGIEVEGIGGAEFVDLHGVIDDQIHRDHGIGFFRIGAKFREGVAHGGEVDHAGHAGEILKQDAGGTEVDLGGGRRGIPFRDVLDIGALDGEVVLKAQEIFEKNLDGIGNAREVEAGFLKRGEPVNLIGAAADAKLARGAEGVLTWHG